MRYRLEFHPRARKEFLALPKVVREHVSARMDGLTQDPRPPGSQDLTGDLRGLRKLRVGDYRAAYEINEAAGSVRLWGFGHRSGFYERIRRRRA